MIILRAANERGYAKHRWLETFHTFSFANYYDPEHMGFSDLRVINDDTISPNRGFGAHPHNDMEIFTYILEGELTHQDSMGNGSTIKPGDIQLMSAGKGVIHSEVNSSLTMPVHLLQIWILPNQTGLTPSYQQTHFPPDTLRNQLRLIISNDGRDQSLKIHQDINIYASKLQKNHEIEFKAAKDRNYYLHLAQGRITLNGNALETGDGAKIIDEQRLKISASEDAEFLLFELRPENS